MHNLLKPGLHPGANTAFLQLGIHPARIVQTIGHASASAGTHAQDGEVDGVPYCAASDLSVLHPTPWDAAAVRHWLDRLASAGFAPFYRHPGHDHWPADEAVHLHVVWPACHMKPELRRQIHDYCHSPMLNGLQSHAPYEFWQPKPEAVQGCRTLFLAINPAVG